MRCALVHDWLTGMRGGEKVLALLCEMFPESDLYTLIHLPGRVAPIITQRRVRTSWLDRLPGVGGYYRRLLPLMPGAAERLVLCGYDLVVATSHCVAHGVTVAGGTPLVCYCQSPMRYAWGPLDSYFPSRRRASPAYWLLRAMRGQLRAWDLRASRRVTEYIANSRNVQERIRRCYGRESRVVYPPVDTDFYRPLDIPREKFYLWAGALAPYKRIDLALEAFRRLGRPLVVIGDGQEFARARRMAPPNVRFLGWQPDETLLRCYNTCRALVFPGEEDFGIVPLEAQACGCPVIALGRGGALETVVDIASAGGAVPTGMLFADASADGLAEAVLRFEEREGEFDPAALRRQALRFSRERCKEALKEVLLSRAEKETSC